MRRSVPAFTILFAFLQALLCVAPALAQQAETNDFEVRGVVINAATGELLRDFTLDPTRDYQPTGAPKGPTRKKPRT